MTKQEARDAVTRWGKILGILVGLTVLAGALRSAGDDRYVTKVDYQREIGEMRGDVKVIKAAVCAQNATVCAAVKQ